MRHAQADRLTVAVDRSALGYHIKISDNGKARPFSLKEGSGLGNLRERLEREGATLQVNCTEGVTLIVDIPSGTGRRKADGENDERFIG